MKFEKKTITLILVAIIGSSLFVGLALAAGGNNKDQGDKDPLSQILKILLRIEPKVGGIQTDLGKTPQILGSYSDEFWSTPPTSGYKFGIIIKINSSKPAIYTVTFNQFRYDAGDYVALNYAPTKPANDGIGGWHTSDYFGLPVPDQFPKPSPPVLTDRTFTIAGYGVWLNYNDFGESPVVVKYTIIVQGEADTKLQVEYGAP